MMRVARLVLLVMALLPIAAFAEDGGPHRVGFVNVAEVLNKSPQVKKLESELKESYETRKAELDKEQEKLNELERKLATEGEGMSFDDRSTLEHQILSMRSKLKQELTWLEEDITIRKSGETSRLIIRGRRGLYERSCRSVRRCPQASQGSLQQEHEVAIGDSLPTPPGVLLPNRTASTCSRHAPCDGEAPGSEMAYRPSRHTGRDRLPNTR
ncbi:MAG: OmpH family outer membrane protein [Gammaproteobacteria bacterium]